MRLWLLNILITLIIPFASFGNSCFRFYHPPMYSNDSAYGLQAYKIHIDRLKTNFRNIKDLTNSNEIANVLLSSDARIVFFRLQSLSRVYEKSYDSIFFQNKKDFFKNFEDLIGKVDLSIGLINIATKLNQKRLIQFFENQKSAAIQKLVASLVAENIISPLNHTGPRIDPSEKLDTVYKELSKFDDWKKSDKDLKLHFKRIAKELRKLHEEIKERKFTQDDIELGLHELRRKLRWPLIHIQTLSRLTAYESKLKLPIEVQNYFDTLLAKNPEIMKSSFLKMLPPDIKHPALIPLYPYAMATELVSEIGTLKDKAEYDIYVIDAMKELNFAPRIIAKVEKDLLQITNRTEKTDHKALSEAYQESLEAADLLLYFAKQLEKLNAIDP